MAAIAVCGSVASSNGGTLRPVGANAAGLVGGRDIMREWARGLGRTLGAS